jgi:uncharacterized protein
MVNTPNLQATAGQSELLHPDNGEVREDVLITMRDGVVLATDIYFPSDGNAPWPVVLERTPYGKQLSNHGDRTLADPTPKSRSQIGRAYAARGYVYVIQDCRGRHGSAGVFSKYVNEGDDGLDTLNWLVAQSWCNGKIGTQGLSYGAHVQAALASMGAKNLGAMVWDSGGFSNAWRSGIRQGGAFELKQLTWAMSHALQSPATLRDPVRQAALAAQDIRDWIAVNPWSEGNSPLAMAPEYEAYVLELWRNEVFSDFWRRPGLYASGSYARACDVPTIFMCSWYDPYSLTAIENFQGFSQDKAGPFRLILGPWTHGQRSVTFAGDVDFGPAAPLDGNIAESYNELRLGWFDQHLKQNATPQEPKNSVQIFVMGGGSGTKTASGKLDHGGQWRSETNWPLPNARPTSFFLGEEGKLSFETGSDGGAQSWIHDPNRPIATNGGAITSGAPVMEAGAYDQGSAQNPSIAIFQTDVLTQDIEVTGPIIAKLWVSSTASDSDICLKLIDLYPPSQDYPNGYALNLSHGILRLKFRNSCENMELMTPSEIYPIEVTVFPTSNLFAQGHRIRLDVASSNFPHFDVNPNTGSPSGIIGLAPVIATNTVHLGPKTPSCIVLPLVQRDQI